MMRVKYVDKGQAWVTIAVSAVMDFLGLLAIPVFLMVGCNLIDYITGLIASKYRDEQINSYKGMRGIVKKVCMWLLVVVGSMADVLIRYAAETMGLNFQIPFIVATLVAVWIVVNEIISILENMIDIGIDLPPFLMPIAKRIKKEIEEVGEDKEKRTVISSSFLYLSFLFIFFHFWGNSSEYHLKNPHIYFSRRTFLLFLHLLNT